MSEAVGTKLDQGKVDVTFLPYEALVGPARVFEYGARKYARENWRGGMPYLRLIAALMRHLWAFIEGEELDSESGLPHIDHALCTLMMLKWMTVHRKDLDNRFKGQVEEVSDEQIQANLKAMTEGTR
jgi:hypothetical protein